MSLPWSGPFALKDTTALTGLPLQNALRNRFAEKRWCYAGVVSQDLFFGAAVVHLGYITSAFAFGFDRAIGRMVEQTLTWPPMGHVRYDRHPEKGTCRFRGLGRHIEIRSTDDGFGKRLLVRLESKRHAIKADLTLGPPETGLSPMHFPMDMGGGKKAFTTKAAGLSARGEVSLNGKIFTLNPEQASGLVDWTHGAYPRSTFWNWACGAGKGIPVSGTDQPVSVGFNFSRGVYENGRLENTLWINGRPDPVQAVRFRYDPAAPMTPWRILSSDSRIDLTFFPEGARSADDNFGLVASRFIQPCGKFEGGITTSDGRKFTLTSAGGVAEEHHARW